MPSWLLGVLGAGGAAVVGLLIGYVWWDRAEDRRLVRKVEGLQEAHANAVADLRESEYLRFVDGEEMKETIEGLRAELEVTRRANHECAEILTEHGGPLAAIAVLRRAGVQTGPATSGPN